MTHERLLPDRIVPVLLDDHLAQFGPPPYPPAGMGLADAVVVQGDQDNEALWLTPHLVLDGLQLTATAAGADEAYVDLGDRPSARLRDSVTRALADRDQAALDVVPAHVGGPPAGVDAVTLTPDVLADVAVSARYGTA